MQSKILFVLCLLFGLMFINAGLDKFFTYMPKPENLSPEMLEVFAAFTKVKWLMPLVGLVEIIGGVLIILPRTRALGALIVFPVIIGILLVNTVNDTTGLPIAAIFVLINVWAIWDNRAKYMPIIKKTN